MANLYDSQKDPKDTEQKWMKPHEYYNLHIRKEGEKVLSEEEFKELMKTKENATTGTGESN